MHDLDDAEEAPEAAHPQTAANWNQDREGRQYLGQRNEDGDREDQDGQWPQPLIEELQDARDQGADLLAAFELESHEGKSVGNGEQPQARDAEGDGVVDPAVGPAVEAGTAARAFGRTALRQGLGAQKQPAVVAFDQCRRWSRDRHGVRPPMPAGCGQA